MVSSGAANISHLSSFPPQEPASSAVGEGVDDKPMIDRD